MLLTKNSSLWTKNPYLGDLCKFYKGGWLNLYFSYSGGVSSFSFHMGKFKKIQHRLHCNFEPGFLCNTGTGISFKPNNLPSTYLWRITYSNLTSECRFLTTGTVTNPPFSFSFWPGAHETRSVGQVRRNLRDYPNVYGESSAFFTYPVSWFSVVIIAS